MRGDNAGDASNQSTAVTLPPTFRAAALIQRCVKCGARFSHDFEEKRCGNCVAWEELHGLAIARLAQGGNW